MTRRDYLKHYDLERYLLEEVSPRFRAVGYLSAFDFFCIVIWKSNRAKTYVARRLLSRGHPTLDEAVRELTESLHSASSDEERLRLLIEEWGFLLPMASAILTMLYPEAFTVYDIRACDELGDFHELANKTAFGTIWRGYASFVEAVRAAAPSELGLRDQDRYLWAKNFVDQLESDVQSNFGLASH